MLSGIQHYKFCPRQWALIHIEQQWNDNHLTIMGNRLHKKVDQPLLIDKRDGMLLLRSVNLISHSLGLRGVADVLELTETNDDQNVITISKCRNNWHVNPVEYKHGKPKRDNCDEVQLCAQAICLEEMYNIHISKGDIFYAAIRRRKTVEFKQELRKLVIDLALEMHTLYDKGITPNAIRTNKCNSCSLKDLCMAGDLQRVSSVSHYLKQLTNNEEIS